jgi:hypothetical protein
MSDPIAPPSARRTSTAGQGAGGDRPRAAVIWRSAVGSAVCDHQSVNESKFDARLITLAPANHARPGLSREQQVGDRALVGAGGRVAAPPFFGALTAPGRVEGDVSQARVKDAGARGALARVFRQAFEDERVELGGQAVPPVIRRDQELASARAARRLTHQLARHSCGVPRCKSILGRAWRARCTADPLWPGRARCAPTPPSRVRPGRPGAMLAMLAGLGRGSTCSSPVPAARGPRSPALSLPAVSRWAERMAHGSALRSFGDAPTGPHGCGVPAPVDSPLAAG